MIMNYLAEGELHPFQILNKQYITKTLVSYDTLFRLVQTLVELEKFKIDVTPSQWLRHRLWELVTEIENEGGEVRLHDIVHSLYSDPKVVSSELPPCLSRCGYS